MANTDDKDVIVENGTATWEMKMEGDITGTYSGVFKFRCFLTPMQTIAANRDYRELIGPNPTMVPEHESFLAYCLSQLKYRIINAPPFWSSARTGSFEGDVPDKNVIEAVLDKAITAEVKYSKDLKKKKLEYLTKAKNAAERLLKQQEEGSEDDGEDKEDID